MNMYVVLLFCCAWLFIIQKYSPGSSAQSPTNVNLTGWRQHRRQKRFILFENAGICKLVTGVALPVDLGDKMMWRQLVMLINLQYQFPVPPRPIYWWERWSGRKIPVGPLVLSDAKAENKTNDSVIDDAQLFLYEFAVQLMEHRHKHGRACLLRAICENAQIHHHRGLFAELLHRILLPHHSLDEKYVDAYRMGQRGVQCREVYAEAKDCLFDRYLHVLDDHFQQTLP